MNNGLGDLADQIASQLTVDTCAPVEEASAITEEAALQAQNSMFPQKIRFTWRPEDRAVLDQIRGQAEITFAEIFNTAIELIDGFFASLWVPEVDGNGVMRRYADGRPVWKRGPDNKPVENWDQLTGQDIEQTLMDLQRVKLEIVPAVHQLLLEALYARHVASDIYDEAWGSVMEGTQGDRTARSNRESRTDRYHAYFRYVLWSTANVFLQEVTAFMRRLERIRGWQLGDKYA